MIFKKEKIKMVKNTFVLILVSLGVFFLGDFASAATYHVGESQETYKTLASVKAVAETGDTIIVDGDYNRNNEAYPFDFTISKSNISISCASSSTILGNSSGDSSVVSSTDSMNKISFSENGTVENCRLSHMYLAGIKNVINNHFVTSSFNFISTNYDYAGTFSITGNTGVNTLFVNNVTSSATLLVDDNQFELRSGTQGVTFLAGQITFSNNEVVLYDQTYNTNMISYTAGDLKGITPDFIATSNTISVAVSSTQIYLSAFSVGLSNTGYDFARSVLFSGNKIDFSKATATIVDLLIFTNSYGTNTATFNILNNTVMSGSNAGSVVGTYHSATGGGGHSNFNLKYNIFNSVGSSHNSSAIRACNTSDVDTNITLDIDYNDYYSFLDHPVHYDQNSVTSCGAPGVLSWSAGTHSLTSQPLFKSSDRSLDNGWTLVPFSELLDVDGSIDMGAVPGTKVTNLLVGDPTWYNNFVGTSSLSIYSTSTSIFTLGNNTTTDWVYVGENPADIINSSLATGTKVLVIPGSYGPVLVSSTVHNVTIGNLAWDGYLSYQSQTKLSATLALNLGSHLDSYDCVGVYKNTLSTIDEETDLTLFQIYKNSCSAQSALGINSLPCQSANSIEELANFICAMPNSAGNEVVFSANVNGNAFEFNNLVSSTVFGFTFVNASSSFYTADISMHSFQKNGLDTAMMTSHSYSINGIEYNHMIQGGAVLGDSFGFTMLNALGTNAIDMATNTNITTILGKGGDYDLILSTSDVGAFGGEGEASGVTTTLAMYINKSEVIEAYAGLITLENYDSVLPYLLGGTIDCYSTNVFDYNEADHSFTYNAPTCEGVTVSGSPMINITFADHDFSYANGDTGILLFSDPTLSDDGQLNSTVITSDSTDITNYISSTPQNWDLAMVSLDPGVMTESGEKLGYFIHMTAYYRHDLFASSGARIAFFQNYTTQFGAQLDCFAENVLEYSNGHYTYNDPSSVCSGVTVSGTPAIDMSASGYAGLKLNNSSDNDFFGIDSENNTYGVWLYGNSNNNVFVGSITPNLATEQNYWQYSTATGSLRDTAMAIYALSSSTALSGLLGGEFVAVPLSDTLLTIDTPSSIQGSLSDVYSTAISTTGTNTFYNVDSDLSGVNSAGTVPARMYYRARVRNVTSSGAAKPSIATTLKSANEINSISATTDADGLTAYSNNLLAASLYSPSNNNVTAGGYNPYLATAGAYSSTVNLASANQTFTVTSTVVSTSGGGGGNNIVAVPIVKVPPYIKSINNNNGEVVLYAVVEKASQMVMAFDPDFSNNRYWINYTTSTKFTLPGTYGEKKIYIKYRTATGGTSLVYIVKVNWNKDEIIPSVNETVKTDSQEVKPEISTTSTTPVVLKFVFKRTLKIGSVGDDVRALQQILRDAKYFTYYKNTGYFGAVTKIALAKYQTANGLKATGVVDNATLDFLNGKETTPTTTVVSKFVFKRTLKIGSTGDDVRALQQILRDAKYFTYYKNTGYFGAVTKIALAKYQTANGLKSTGIVDNATLDFLNAPQQ